MSSVRVFQWDMPANEYNIIVAAADKHGVPRELMLAVACKESGGGDDYGVRWSGARGDNCHEAALQLPCNGTDADGNCSFGLFQLQRCRGVGTGHSIPDLLNPVYNANVAARKMRQLYEAAGRRTWNVLWPTWSSGPAAYAMYVGAAGTARAPTPAAPTPAAPPPPVIEPSQPAVNVTGLTLNVMTVPGGWLAQPAERLYGTLYLANPTTRDLTYGLGIVWKGAADGSEFAGGVIAVGAGQTGAWSFALTAPSVPDVYAAHVGVSAGDGLLVDPNRPEQGNWTLQIGTAAPPPLIGPTEPAAPGGFVFVLGFKQMHDLIPQTVGEPLENEHPDPQSGDTIQRTTKGMLVWRSSTDGRIAFTNGADTWIIGPYGLQKRANTERFPWE